MKTVHVKKTFNVGSGTNNRWTKWKLMMDEIVLPIFQDFNNLTYIGMSEVANAGQYVFQFKDTTNLYLRITYVRYNASAQYPSIVLGLSNNGSLSSNDGWIGTSQSFPSERISWVDDGTKVHMEFWMYYIADEDNNLQVFWTPNPSFGGRDWSNPKVFCKTVKDRDVILDFPSTYNSLNVFYPDDSTLQNFYITQDTTQYSSATDVMKSTHIPINPTNAYGATEDIINENLVRIYNNNIDSWYAYNSFGASSSSFVRKLIRIGDDYYRQLVGNWWFIDPLGDEPIVEYLDT